MMRRSLPVIGAMLGAAYFFVTLATAYFFGGEQEGAMVIMGLTNIHLSVFFALLENFESILPLEVRANLYFQILVGISINALVGWLIGLMIERWKRRIIAPHQL